jgi:iron(III) transport system ATP-binding protein
MALLKVSGIGGADDGNIILKNISFSQKKYQNIAIAGETGSGKSTLLKIIAGLIQPDEGEVFLEDQKVTGPEDKLVAGHEHIAYLSQHFELPKFLRVEQVLTYANALTEASATSLYEVCQISHLLKRKTDQLSGGEKQRIAICRLLIASPRLLLLDEPFSHLDMVHKNVLKTVINEITRKLKISCMLVSHDPLDTLSWADKILVMKEGTLIQKGAPERIYHEPVNEYVAGIFGKYNILGSDIMESFGIHHVSKNSKRPFLRPEDFKIGSKNKRSVSGKVLKVTFFGSYFEVQVSILKQVILVRNFECSLVEGDEVFLSLASHKVWFI